MLNLFTATGHPRAILSVSTFWQIIHWTQVTIKQLCPWIVRATVRGTVGDLILARHSSGIPDNVEWVTH